MTCRHCHQPIQRCGRGEHRAPGGPCKGWVHAGDGWHYCPSDAFIGPMAEPEPGTLPTVQAPASKPKGAVA